MLEDHRGCARFFSLRVFVASEESDIAILDDNDWDELRKIILEEVGRDIDEITPG